MAELRLDPRKVIPVEEALQLMLAAVPQGKTATETVDLLDAVGRVLAQEVLAPSDVPNHTRSSVDGYAVRAADTVGAGGGATVTLQLAGEVFMGRPATMRLQEGQAVRVPTGGMLPEGADAMVMQEDTSVDGGRVQVRKAAAVGDNVVYRGEDVRQGQVVLAPGRRLRAADIGLLAAVGQSRVQVVRTPRVAVLSTGDEVVPPSWEPGPGQVRDSNGPALVAALRQDGADAVLLDIVGDDADALEGALRQAAEFDMVLVSGGSSVGARDLTIEVLDRLGARLVLHGVAIRPGKPTGMALLDGIPIMILPGHPVSALVIYRLFARPVLERWMGLEALAGRPPATVRARLARAVTSAAGRTDFIRVVLERRQDEVWAVPLGAKSGLITTLARADGLVRILSAQTGLAEGEWVEVWPEFNGR